MILWSADYLEARGVPSARLDAEHLLAHAVGTDRLQLYLDFERPLTPLELDEFRPLLKRRAAREPLQYVLAHQPFRELDLRVGPAALIPRPETELLVEAVLEWVRNGGIDCPNALDLGTGTGAIGLSLAREGSFGRVVATDVSTAALELARMNAQAAQVEVLLDFRSGSDFEPLDPEERFHVIVSNPPYIAEVDEEALLPEVRAWEPAEALFAGADGLDVIRTIAAESRRHLEPGGLLALEFGEGQGPRVTELLEAAGGFEQIRITQDYSGRDRFAFAIAA
jgi:release factor glutamine methyltransferase